MLSEEGAGGQPLVACLEPRTLCLFSASCTLRSLQFDVSIEVEKDARLWVIAAEAYQRVMQESAPLANYTNQLMAMRFSEVMWLMEQILWKSMDKRLAAFLLEESALKRRIPAFASRTKKSPPIWEQPAKWSRACCAIFRAKTWCGSPGAKCRSCIRKTCARWRKPKESLLYPASWPGLIVDKPLVCQRGLPGRLQIKDLRPAAGTGMHFYRKCKHLLCKKCQK